MCFFLLSVRLFRSVILFGSFFCASTVRLVKLARFLFFRAGNAALKLLKQFLILHPSYFFPVLPRVCGGSSCSFVFFQIEMWVQGEQNFFNSLSFGVVCRGENLW